jgi:hypothetical protein
MKLALPAGSTSVSLPVYIVQRDDGTNPGRPLTGLVFNTASLAASYVRPGAARAAITLATQTVTGAWSSGGFVEIDATNMPGWYRFDIPDAALASGVPSVGAVLRGAAGMADLPLEIQLQGMDVAQIANSATAAGNLQKSARSMVFGTVSSASGPSGGLTTIVWSAISPAPSDTDQLKGLIIKFYSAANGGLLGQGSPIQGNNTTQLTCTQLTQNPQSGDLFVIG